jgi:LacI family transcriptional regulator
MGPHSLAVAQTRLEGYKQALANNALPFDSHLVKEVDFSVQATFQAMRELMQLQNPPTAVFSFKNYLNLDAVDYLKNNMPAMLGKIDFAGFGNLPMLQYLEYKPVASVEESPCTLGEEAARLVFSLIHNEEGYTGNTYQRIKIPCKLIVHENS